MTDALLRLDRIDTFYGPVQVHFGLSLEVGRGEIVCLLGGNASGKSTTMKIILGLQKPRSGAVLGAVVLIGLPEVIRATAEYRMLIYGLALLLLIRYRPQGILGTV